jgi:transposase
MRKGALAWGYTTDLWTPMRIAQVILQEFKIKFHRAHVGRLLARLEWSCQKPERRAVERDEKAIENGNAMVGQPLKKSPAIEGPLGFSR